MALDYSALANAVARLAEGLARDRRDTTDARIRDGLIERFGLTCDLLHKMLRRALELAMPFIVLLIVATVARWQTFDNPVVGADEQFYLVVGDRMLHGALPYVDIFDRKPIGLFLVFAAIRTLGGAGIIQYQVVALAVVVATALLIYATAKPLAGRTGALVAGCLYILWLNFMEGEGGEAEVFFNLPMLVAAILVRRAWVRRQAAMLDGAIIMLLVGVTLQIKYTVVFEGGFFGCALLWTRFQSDPRVSRLVRAALLWIFFVLLPTLAAAAYYAHRGALQPFIFANFQSQFGKFPEPPQKLAKSFVSTVLILSPLLGLAAGAIWQKRADRFATLWLAASLGGYLGMRMFVTPHYAMPMLAPLLLTGAPNLRHPRWLWFLPLPFVVGQVVLAHNIAQKGDRATLERLAAITNKAARPIYVYDGYSALYLLTGSRLPTKWNFPGHLDFAVENSRDALGVNPVDEERRILATAPSVIYTRYPEHGGGNEDTYRIVQAELSRSYHLAIREKLKSCELRGYVHN